MPRPRLLLLAALSLSPLGCSPPADAPEQPLAAGPAEPAAAAPEGAPAPATATSPELAALLPAEGEQPDIVLITVDGLRADPAGEDFAEAAFLGGLAETWERAPTWRFRAAYAQSVQPFISLASLLVGRYPSGIPICGRPTTTAGLGEAVWCTRVPDTQRPLPEVLGIYGYKSALTYQRLVEGRDLEPLYPRVLITNPTDDRDPDYDLTRRAAATWWEDSAGAPRFLTACLSWLSSAEGLMVKAVGSPAKLDEAQQAAVAEIYREGAAGLGREAGRLLSALPGDPWVVITSGHGLSLGETVGSWQPEQLYRPTHQLLLDRTVRVPLLIFAPGGGETREIDWPVELVDLFPALARLGGAVPPSALSGQDLLGQIAAGAPEDAWGYSEFGDMLSLRSGDYFLVFRNYLHGGSSLDPALTENLQQEPRQGDDNYRLYKVTTDPMQAHTVAHLKPRTVRELRDQLLQIRTGEGAPPDGSMTREGLQALKDSRKMGYW
jgi:hypothetical protein